MYGGPAVADARRARSADRALRGGPGFTWGSPERRIRGNESRLPGRTRGGTLAKAERTGQGRLCGGADCHVHTRSREFAHTPFGTATAGQHAAPGCCAAGWALEAVATPAPARAGPPPDRRGGAGPDAAHRRPAAARTAPDRRPPAGPQVRRSRVLVDARGRAPSRRRRPCPGSSSGWPPRGTSGPAPARPRARCGRRR
jgi:hypothetical protein